MASGVVGTPQTFNRYAYVGNNPLNSVDPSGMAMKNIEHGGSYYDAETFGKLQEFRHRQQPWVISQGQKKPPQKPPTVLGPYGQIPGDVIVINSEPGNKLATDSDTQPPYDPSTRVAKDNDDFRQVNLSLSPKLLVGAGIHFALTWDKYGRRYFSVGPTVGIGLTPVTANLLTGQTNLDGIHVRDKASVESILTGPSASINICPVVCAQTGWNIPKWSFFGGPPVPKGTGTTIAAGVGVPEISTGKDWTWKLPF